MNRVSGCCEYEFGNTEAFFVFTLLVGGNQKRQLLPTTAGF